MRFPLYVNVYWRPTVSVMLINLPLMSYAHVRVLSFRSMTATRVPVEENSYFVRFFSCRSKVPLAFITRELKTPGVSETYEPPPAGANNSVWPSPQVIVTACETGFLLSAIAYECVQPMPNAPTKELCA